MHLSKIKEITERLSPLFSPIEATVLINAERVLNAFTKLGVRESDFHGTSGYGYDDAGRAKLEAVYAHLFGAEQALVRSSILTGTHAITLVLFGLLRPGDTLLSITGAPYDTLHGVIGIRPQTGSLQDWGVKYEQMEFLATGIDFADLGAKLAKDPSVRVVYLQRSRGYAERSPLSVAEIKQVVDLVRSITPQCYIVVDNCYGEFVETMEPTHVGVDVCAGSLLKNLGGGLAPTGGYIVGTSLALKAIEARYSAPGIGGEIGPNPEGHRLYFQGLFLAPKMVGEALKTSVATAYLFAEAGFSVFPSPEAPRHDLIQTIRLQDPEQVILFCQQIQAFSPVDSNVRPEPWAMPGYDAQVIMAAGGFIQGGSLELSADAPLRPPYDVFLQGGLYYESAMVTITRALDAMLMATK